MAFTSDTPGHTDHADSNGTETDSSKRFYLITHIRTASNLLVKILGLDQQPEVELGDKGPAGYFFMNPMIFRWANELASRPIAEWTDEEKNSVERIFQESFDSFEEYLENAKSNNKIAFVKEHAYFYANPSTQWRRVFDQPDDATETRWRVQVPSKYSEKPTWSSLNKTILPDEFLRTFKPIFLIRHPAMMFPSALRASLDLKEELKSGQSNEATISLTLETTRTLYDWYVQDMKQSATGAASSSSQKSNDVTWPVVVDADDTIGNPAVVARLCKIVGLDEAKMRFQWEPFTKEQDEKLRSPDKRMLSTLRASTGIVKEKAATAIDIDAEAEKWKTEFGDEDGAMLEKRVREAMPHYEYLKARKLRPE